VSTKPTARVWVSLTGFSARVSISGDGKELPAEDARAALDAGLRAGNGWARGAEGSALAFSQPPPVGCRPLGGGALRGALKTYAMGAREAARSELEARGYRVRVSRPL